MIGKDEALPVPCSRKVLDLKDVMFSGCVNLVS